MRGEGFVSEIGSATWPARGAVVAAETALFADGVMEYEVDGDRLGVTLLRAVGQIAKPTLATRPIWAGPSTPTPEGQCFGTYQMDLGVLVGVSREGLVQEWERFGLPFLELEAPGEGEATEGRLLDVAGAHLSSVRRHGGSVQVRLWNDLAVPRVASVEGQHFEIRPPGIETVSLER